MQNILMLVIVYEIEKQNQNLANGAGGGVVSNKFDWHPVAFPFSLFLTFVYCNKQVVWGSTQ